MSYARYRTLMDTEKWLRKELIRKPKSNLYVGYLTLLIAVKKKYEN